jgi:TolB-like protein/DNA-binding winged helix-turn-helix (wHTH) protein/Tfp pilus assembly protein PilF
VPTFQLGRAAVSTQVQSHERLSFLDYELDCRSGELRRNGTTLRLQPQPAKILAILATRAGQVVTRQELAEQVWGANTYVDFEHGLNFAVRQIRSVLEDDPDNPRFLETVPKRGYRFITQVTGPIQPQGAAPAARPISRMKLVISVGVAVVSLAFFVAMRLWPRKASVSHNIDSVAVLPLRNLSNDPEQEYFSEGMTDQLITDLARVGGLRVISHTSVERYRDTTRPLPDIARELGVAAVVEGTVMRSGDRVRITAQLIDAPSDQHLWADSYERDFRDALVLQDEISRKIASEIGSTLAPGKSASGAERAVDPAAYEAYLRASFSFDHMNCTSFELALAYFQDAVAKDPNFARAQSGLADTYFNIGEFPCRQPAPYDEAEAAALKAVALDPANADAHAVLAKIAFSRDWNWTKAAREFSMAVQLDPNNAGIHSAYGFYLVAMGKEYQGLAEERKAQELDPFSEKTNFWQTLTLYMARRYDEAIDHANHTLTLFSSYAEYYWLGECYEKKGMPDKAIEYYLDAMAGEPDEVPLRRAAYQKDGLPGYWQEEERIRRRKKYGIGPFRQAEYYVHRGMKEEAIKQLQLAYKLHARGMELIKMHPIFDSLRSDPRFKELLIGLRLQ